MWRLRLRRQRARAVAPLRPLHLLRRRPRRWACLVAVVVRWGAGRLGFRRRRVRLEWAGERRRGWRSRWAGLLRGGVRLVVVRAGAC